jgi:hypothetical protein
LIHAFARGFEFVSPFELHFTLAFAA